MSLRALPLIVIALVLYNIVVLFGGSASVPAAGAAGTTAGAPAVSSTAADSVPILHRRALPIPITKGTLWLTVGDLLVTLTMLLLFIELMKSTYTSSTSLLDHGLSMLVFVACLIEFLMVSDASSSTFFFITLAAMIDVVAGYTIGIRVARRDLSIGGDA